MRLQHVNSGPALKAMLIMLGFIGPFALQIFLPSVPGLIDEFGVDHATVQLTISLYLATFAVAQLCLGPLSDRFGRRRVILAGVATYVVAPVICANAASIEALAAGRMLQAVGACAGLMFSRVVARDLYGRDMGAAMIGFITMSTALMGAATPLLGGWIDVTFGWRISFWLAAVFGAVVLTVTYLWFPETHPGGRGTSVLATFVDGRRLLRSPMFLGYACHGMCTLSAWYAMVAGLPFAMVDALKQSPTAFGAYFPLLSLGYMTGNLLTSRIAASWGIHRMLNVGIALALLACPLMLAWCLVLGPSPLALFLPMGLISLGHGLSQPAATSAAIGVIPTLAGSAAGFMGFGQWMVAAATTQAVGALQNATVWPTVIVVIGFTVLSALAYLFGRHAERRSLDSGPEGAS
jgi:DHA1 family bicyclomycin/chloramphenicol resistance-like MFS transporter